MSIESMMPSIHLILCHPLLLLPSNFPSIRVFSNESALRIRWPKYWSFSFNISPYNDYSGLISFRMLFSSLSLLHRSTAAATDRTEARLRGATPRPGEQRLHRCRRAERISSTFKVRRGSHEEISLVQDKEQRLRFAGAAVKRYPTPKVRETQVKR